MITRKQYLDSAGQPDSGAAYRAYYAQFVDDRVRALVARTFGVDTLRRTSDQAYFNSVPLARWDRLVGQLPRSVHDALVAAGDYLTLGTGVCLLKEAAKQLVEAAGEDSQKEVET